MAALIGLSLGSGAFADNVPRKWKDGTHMWPTHDWYSLRFEQEFGAEHSATADPTYSFKRYLSHPFLISGRRLTDMEDSQIETSFELKGFYPMGGTPAGETITVNPPMVYVQMDKTTGKLLRVDLARQGSIRLQASGNKDAVYTDCTVDFDQSNFVVDLGAGRFGFEVNEACNGGYSVHNFYELQSVTPLQ